jgi:hypothetical protein
MRHALRHPARETEALRVALLDPDPVIRTIAAAHIFNAKDRLFDAFAVALLRDRAGPIRHRALVVGLERGMDLALEQLLLDADAPVRRTAQRQLRSMGSRSSIGTAGISGRSAQAASRRRLQGWRSAGAPTTPGRSRPSSRIPRRRFGQPRFAR